MRVNDVLNLDRMEYAMVCKDCGGINDDDASFCTLCGSAAADARKKTLPRSGIWLPASILVIALIALASVGYYKFVLPNGVIAVVNGEEIREQDLKIEMRTALGEGLINPDNSSVNKALEPRLRYDILMRLIRERIMLQEAKKAALTVTNDDVLAAVDRIRKDSGMDDKGFAAFIEQRYGGMAAFENMLKKKLLIEQLILRKIAPGLKSFESIQAAVAKWLHDASTRANVRIALSQQWSGDGCECCNRGVEQAPKAGAKKGDSGAVSAEKKAAASQAGLEYWREKYRDKDVTADVTDFGCHMQIDIVKDGRVLKSLRYQNGKISEM